MMKHVRVRVNKRDDDEVRVGRMKEACKEA